MGGKLLDKLCSSTLYHIPYVGDVYSRSIITVGKFGVALPVPKNNAREGRIMLSINSFERPQSLRVYLMGMRAKKTSRRRIHLMAVLKRRMSFWCLATSWVGKRLVQNCKVSGRFLLVLFVLLAPARTLAASPERGMGRGRDVDIPCRKILASHKAEPRSPASGTAGKCAYSISSVSVYPDMQEDDKKAAEHTGRCNSHPAHLDSSTWRHTASRQYRSRRPDHHSRPAHLPYQLFPIHDGC